MWAVARSSVGGRVECTHDAVEVMRSGDLMNALGGGDARGCCIGAQQAEWVDAEGRRRMALGLCELQDGRQSARCTRYRNVCNTARRGRSKGKELGMCTVMQPHAPLTAATGRRYRPDAEGPTRERVDQVEEDAAPLLEVKANSALAAQRKEGGLMQRAQGLVIEQLSCSART